MEAKLSRDADIGFGGVRAGNEEMYSTYNIYICSGLEDMPTTCSSSIKTE